MRRFTTRLTGGIGAGDGWRILENLLGGALILVVWLALWVWVLLGVVGPLSSHADAARRADVIERA